MHWFHSRVTCAVLLTAGLVGIAGYASAQTFFDMFFGPRYGRRPPPPSMTYPYADPYAERRAYRAPRGFADPYFYPRRPYADPRYADPDDAEGHDRWGRAPYGFPHRRDLDPYPDEDRGRSLAFCVRLCDGRYFPVQRTDGPATPIRLCRALCPASATRVFEGSDIDTAASADGTRYAELPNAFVYRKQIVSNCTCNGKDAFGLARINVEDDPTLRPGDIVATRDGLKAYSETRRGQAVFAPLKKEPGLTREQRARLGRTPVMGRGR